jgi:hypothetical protein
MTRIDTMGLSRPITLRPLQRPVAITQPAFGSCNAEPDRAATDAKIIKLGLLRALIPLGVLAAALTAASIFGGNGKKQDTPQLDKPPTAEHQPFKPGLGK